MGQQNDKVLFEGHHQQPTARRKHIFPTHPEPPQQLCEIPGCNCPLPHPQINAKICSQCQHTPPPFLKTKNKPKYYEDKNQPSPYQPLKHLEMSPPRVTEAVQAQSIPGRITYYNAWSLPTHKYHIRERQPFGEKKQAASWEVSGGQGSEKVQQFIQRVTEKIVKAVDPPKAELQRRKQNMNLTD